MKHLVTVVIPCYNDGAYVKKAVESVLSQTYSNFTIFIVDDGSNQDTKDVLSTISHEKIKVHYQVNKGVSNARNQAIEMSDTKYILTLDADDYFEPTFLEKAIDILEANEPIGIVASHYNIVEREREGVVVKPVGGTIENFLNKNEGVASALFRRKCWEEVQGYDEKMKDGYEDWEFWIAILSKSWQMRIIEESLFNYRVKEHSRDKSAREEHDLKLKKYIFNKHKNSYKEHFEVVFNSLIEKNDFQKKKINKLERSRKQAIDNMFLKPFKIFKR